MSSASGTRLELCGGLALDLDGHRLGDELRGTQGGLCLAYLALNRERAVRRDELVEALWPGRPPARPEAALATVLSRLRSALGPGIVEGRSALRLRLPDGARVDVEDAAEELERAEMALAAGDAGAAFRAATSAAEVAAHELLPGLEGDWLDERRRQLDDLRTRALECVAEAGGRLGGRELQGAERAARELIRLAPYRESAHRLLMESLAARGDVGEALRVYDDLRVRLRDEIGAAPSRELVALHERLVAGDVQGPSEAAVSGVAAGTATLLFAELVGLGELVERAGDETAARTRTTCLRLLRDAARASDGHELDASGDGLGVAFKSSVKALACATLMQQTIRHHAQTHPDRALALRVGVHVGEIDARDEPYFGAAALVARELCRRAEPGRAYVSELVRSLTGTRGGHRFLDLGSMELEPAARSLPVHELLWRPARADGGRADDDTGGADVVQLTAADIAQLERLLAASGLADVSLAGRYSVVFAYPGMGLGDLHLELAGCSTQVCAILEETANFERHGLQVVGLSTEPTVPPAGCTELTFPAGILPQAAVGRLVPTIDKPTRRYAARTSFVVFPDRTGVRIGGVTDVIAHVKKSFDAAIERRLDGYRRAAISHLERGLADLRPTVELRELLPPGADSVAIPRVQLKLDLVAKLAEPDVVAAEAAYVQRINRLFDEHGLDRLFPAVVGVVTDEQPAWFLMEAVDPVSVDQLLFADRERTVLHEQRRRLLTDALERISKLYELTFRRETPAVARYHYLDRFLAIPERDDTRATFDSLVGGSLDDMLERELVLDGGFLCRSYRDQMRFLEANVERLLEPIGAYVHGDFHLPNMLLDADGRRIVLIDPRVVWDGHDVGDPGFCDPLYDPATLLQSLHLAAPLLRALADGESRDLLHVRDAGQRLEAESGVLRLHGNPTVAWFVEWVERALPARLLGNSWRSRLHIGTANACLGWMKYAGSVKTREAWLAVVASVLYHLERGRRELEAGAP